MNNNAVFKEVIEELDSKLAVLDEAIFRVNNNPDLSDTGKKKQIEPITAKKLEAEKEAKETIKKIAGNYKPTHDWKKLSGEQLNEVAAKLSIAKATGTAIDDVKMQTILADLAGYDLTPIAEVVDRHNYPKSFEKENAFKDKMTEYSGFEKWLNGLLESSFLVYTYNKEDLKSRTAYGSIIF